MYFIILLIILYWYYIKPKDENKIDLEIELEELINKRNAYIVSILTNQKEDEQYKILNEQIKKVKKILKEI